MVNALEPLLADGVIDEVLARLKSGKEADLWLVRHGVEVVAAKVYKAREARSFRNDAVYREGRQVRNTRTQRAMDRGSRFGQAASEEAWKAKEADALHALHAAGVRVPRPVLFYEGVLLMELVVDAAGHPAPRLIDAQISREQAGGLYADLRGQAVRMLAADLVHGDLSPYNVLLGAAGPVVIDFPQVIGAAHNSQAERFFRRDLENLREFFAALDPALDAAAGDAHEIWRAYVRRELSPGFVPTGRAPPEPRREGAPASRPSRGAPQPHRGGPRPAPARGAPARSAAPPLPARPAPQVPQVVQRPASQGTHRPHRAQGARPGPSAPARGPQPPPRPPLQVTYRPPRPGAPPAAPHPTSRAAPQPMSRAAPQPTSRAAPSAPRTAQHGPPGGDVASRGSGGGPAAPGAGRRRRRRGARNR